MRYPKWLGALAAIAWAAMLVQAQPAPPPPPPGSGPASSGVDRSLPPPLPQTANPCPNLPPPPPPPPPGASGLPPALPSPTVKVTIPARQTLSIEILSSPAAQCQVLVTTPGSQRPRTLTGSTSCEGRLQLPSPIPPGTPGGTVGVTVTCNGGSTTTSVRIP